MAQQPISLQSPVGDGEDTNFGDFIEDKAAENPSDMTSYSLLKDKLGDVLCSLTEREREILKLVAEGYTNNQIAERLVISPKTVDTHRTHVMDKLNLHSRAELVKYAMRRGLLED